MVIIGCDYHPSMQQIAWLDTATGEGGERRLEHSGGEAERFYRELKQRGVQVRVGIEASGHTRWFERLLAELGMELWIGNPAKIATQRVRKQKTDRQDAQLLLQLLVEGRFPRLWVPSAENRDLRQLLWHRHRLVQMRTVGSYLGLIPCEDSSAGKQRLGRLSKQGNVLLRYLLVEAAQAAVRCDAQWRRRFVRLAMRRQRSIAVAAMARKLAVSLYWMWRKAEGPPAAAQFGSHVGQLD